MNITPYSIFKYSILLLFLQSMYAWFLWGQLVNIIVLCVAVTFFFGLTSGDKIYSFKKWNIIPVFFIVIIEIYVVNDQNENALIAAILRIVIISIVLFLNDKIKIDLFQFLTKLFAILLAVSVFAWILFLIRVPLPHSLTSFGDKQYVFDNYYFFLYNHVDDIVPVPRFSSIFLEPGHLGMITSFLLCANKFELKRKAVLVIFVATLFTFSLAAYVLMLISLSVYFIIASKKPIFNFIIWITILFSLYQFFINLNEGENVVNNFIIERLKSDKVNNRFSEDMDYYYPNFLNTENVYFGIGSIAYNKLFLGANAGYRVFMIQYGIFGTAIIFLFYFSVLFGKQSKMGWILFLVYALCFLQAAYPLWEVELLIFIVSLPFFMSTNRKFINERN